MASFPVKTVQFYEIILTFFVDFDTDEETAELLDKQYPHPAKVDIPELSKPPVNRSVQVMYSVF